MRVGLWALLDTLYEMSVAGHEGAGAAGRARIALLVAALLLAVYLANGRLGRCPDCTPNALLPLAILDRGDLYLDAYASELDGPGGYAFAERDGHVLSYYPIPSGLLALPLHLAARALGIDVHASVFLLARLTAALAVAAGGAFLFALLARLGFDVSTAVLVALAIGLGTTAYSVASQGLWQHGPSLLFLDAGLFFLAGRGRRDLVFAGLALGLAIFNRPSNAVLVAPLAVYAILDRRRDALAFFLGLALPLLAMAWYSSAYWGSTWALGQGHRATGTHGAHRIGFGAPLSTTLPALLFSPNRGLFVYSPFLVFGALGLARRTSLRLTPFLALGLVVHLLLTARWNVWWGGWCWGYRLITEELPALGVGVALAWEGWARAARGRRVIFFVLLAASIYAAYLGASHATLADWNQAVDVDRHPERVWDVGDTQLGRAHQRFLSSLEGT